MENDHRSLPSEDCVDPPDASDGAEGTHCVYEVGLALLTFVNSQQDFLLLIDIIHSFTLSVCATTAARSNRVSKVRWVQRSLRWVCSNPP